MRTAYSNKYEVDLTQMPLVDESPALFLSRYPVPDVCIICLEELQPDLPLRQLPCEHLFHQPCIDAWVCDRDTKCPLCGKTFYHLRRLREGWLPSDQANYGRTGDRRGSDAVRGKFKTLKAWYKNRRHGQPETTPSTRPEQ